jgi:hypothetical protein
MWPYLNPFWETEFEDEQIRISIEAVRKKTAEVMKSRESLIRYLVEIEGITPEEGEEALKELNKETKSD